MTDSFFGTESVKVVRLEDWMQWASGQEKTARRVVLPMIQRGSVGTSQVAGLVGYLVEGNACRSDDGL